jgi:hypothetical protein
MGTRDLLDEHVIGVFGPLQQVRRWWRGVYPGRGIITQSWTGWETVEEKEKLVPVHTFRVRRAR